MNRIKAFPLLLIGLVMIGSAYSNASNEQQLIPWHDTASNGANVAATASGTILFDINPLGLKCRSSSVIACSLSAVFDPARLSGRRSSPGRGSDGKMGPCPRRSAYLRDCYYTYFSMIWESNSLADGAKRRLLNPETAVARDTR